MLRLQLQQLTAPLCDRRPSSLLLLSRKGRFHLNRVDFQDDFPSFPHLSSSSVRRIALVTPYPSVCIYSELYLRSLARLRYPSTLLFSLTCCSALHRRPSTTSKGLWGTRTDEEGEFDDDQRKNRCVPTTSDDLDVDRPFPPPLRRNGSPSTKQIQSFFQRYTLNCYLSCRSQSSPSEGAVSKQPFLPFAVVFSTAMPTFQHLITRPVPRRWIDVLRHN